MARQGKDESSPIVDVDFTRALDGVESCTLLLRARLRRNPRVTVEDEVPSVLLVCFYLKPRYSRTDDAQSNSMITIGNYPVVCCVAVSKEVHKNQLCS